MAEPAVCVVGVDMGATSMKVSVVDTSGRERGSATCSYPTHMPHPGWSEQDPNDWWLALQDAVPRALAAAGYSSSEVQAVSFSAGAHTPVLVGAQGEVLRRAILWSDQRSGAEAHALNEAHGPHILDKAFNHPTATWTLPQLMWLSRNEPATVRATRRLMVAKDWLRMRVCGEWHTDITDAVGTMLWDCREGRWSEALCALADWKLSTLPPVVAAATVVGHVTNEASLHCGLRAGTPVVCGTSDTSAEAYVAGAEVGGAAVVKLATAGTITVVDTTPHVIAGLINYPFAIPDLWYAIAATNSCGSAHRWLRDRFFMRPGDDGAAVFVEMDRLAGTTSPGASGLLFHPYLLGERSPYWDPLLRADFVGLTLRHERGHLVRALYEGIAFSLRDLLGQIREAGHTVERARIIGGGARSALWRQIISDILGIRLEMPEWMNASHGVALLAGVGAGLFADERAARAAGPGELAAHSPNPATAAMYDDLYELYRETKVRLTDVCHRLHAFES